MRGDTRRSRHHMYCRTHRHRHIYARSVEKKIEPGGSRRHIPTYIVGHTTQPPPHILSDTQTPLHLHTINWENPDLNYLIKLIIVFYYFLVLYKSRVCAFLIT